MPAAVEIAVASHERHELIDITAKVKQVVKNAGIESGMCVVFVPHTTAGICVNENTDPDVRTDIVHALKKAVPKDQGFVHDEGNSDAHAQAALIGASQSFIVENGKLLLGKWQAIYFVECDGPRTRDVFIKVVGG